MKLMNKSFSRWFKVLHGGKYKYFSNTTGNYSGEGQYNAKISQTLELDINQNTPPAHRLDSKSSQSDSPIIDTPELTSEPQNHSNDKFVMVFTPHPTNMFVSSAEEEIETHTRYIEQIMKTYKPGDRLFAIKNWVGFDYDRGAYTWRHTLKKYAISNTIPLLTNHFKAQNLPQELISKLREAEEYFNRINEASRLSYLEATQEIQNAWTKTDLNKLEEEILAKLKEYDPNNKVLELFQSIGFVFPPHQLRISSSYLDGRDKEGEEKIDKLIRILAKLRYKKSITDIIIAEYQNEGHLQALYDKLIKYKFEIGDTNIIPLIEKGEFLPIHEKNAQELRDKFKGYRGDMFAGSDTMKADGAGKTVANMCRIALLAKNVGHDFVFYGIGTTPFRSNGANHKYLRDFFSIVKTLTKNPKKDIYIMSTVQGGHLHDLLKNSKDFITKYQFTWDNVVELKKIPNEKMMEHYNEFNKISDALYDSYTSVFKTTNSFISMLRNPDGPATILGIALGYAGTGSRQKQNLEVRNSQRCWKTNDLRAIDFQYMFRLLGLASGFADFTHMTPEIQHQLEDSIKRGNPITQLYYYLTQCASLELRPTHLQYFDDIKEHPTILSLQKGIENWKKLNVDNALKIDEKHLCEVGYYIRVPNKEEQHTSLAKLANTARFLREPELSDEVVEYLEHRIKAGHTAFVRSQSIGSIAGVKS